MCVCVCVCVHECVCVTSDVIHGMRAGDEGELTVVHVRLHDNPGGLPRVGTAAVSQTGVQRPEHVIRIYTTRTGYETQQR